MTDLPAAGNIRLRVFFTQTTSQSPRLHETLATVAITRGNSRSVFSLVEVSWKIQYNFGRL